jgi:predicted nucleotidyltransferase component of viral defense system
MKLPEPVRRAWVGHRETLLRIAGEKVGGRLLIGGGTILASRWGHRLSEDIDVLLPDRDVVNDTHPGGDCPVRC